MPPDDPIVPVTPAAPVVASEPAPAPVAAPAAEPIPAAAAPAPAAEPVAIPAAEPAAPAPAAEPAPKEFAPSLLDEAAKPTAEAKPAEPAPAAAPGEPAKPSEKKEPAVAEAAKAAEPPVPIEYKFNYPEGIKPEDLNQEQLGAFTGILQEARVPTEAAQKLFDLHTNVVKDVAQQMAERQWRVFEQTQKQWRDQVMADPELGGSRHSTAIKTVMNLLDAYSQREQSGPTPRSADIIAAERKGLLDVFRMTGVANNPEFLRFAHWAGDVLTREGTPRPAPPPRAQPLSGQNRGLRRYQGTTPVNGAG